MAHIIKTLRTSVKGVLSTTGTSFVVQSFTDHKGNAVSYADFAGNFVGVLEQGSKIELVLCNGITQNPDDTATITVATSGRHLDGKPPYAGSSTGLRFTTGAKFTISNDPYTLSKFANVENDNSFSGDNDFSNFPTKIGSLIATANDQFMTYGHALALLTGSATIDQTIISATAGENLTQGNAVYFKEADQKWWKASASAEATSRGVRLGVAQQTVLANASVDIFLDGIDKTQSGKTPGSKYYLGDTAGTLTTTPGTYEVFMGWAISATVFLWGHNEDVAQLTYDEKSALQTTLDLSEDNIVIDEGSVTTAGTYTATTIAFVDSNPDTITDSANGFITAGFKRGQEITVSGSASNNGTFRIKSVVAGTITLVATASLVAESVGASVTIVSVKASKVLQLKPDGKMGAVDISNATGAPALDAQNMTNVPVQVPVFEQIRKTEAWSITTSASNKLHGAVSDATGAVFYTVASEQNNSILAIQRWEIDATTGLIFATHNTTISISYNAPTGAIGLSVVGDYLYVTFQRGLPDVKTYRLNKADLTVSTLMSYSGTAPSSGEDNHPSYANEAGELVIYSTGSTWYRYTISGTTLTNAGTVTGHSTPKGAVFDGSKVYINNGSGVITRYATTGGSAEATSEDYDRGFSGEHFPHIQSPTNYTNYGVCLHPRSDILFMVLGVRDATHVCIPAKFIPVVKP